MSWKLQYKLVNAVLEGQSTIFAGSEEWGVGKRGNIWGMPWKLVGICQGGKEAHAFKETTWTEFEGDLWV